MAYINNFKVKNIYIGDLVYDQYDFIIILG